MTKYLFNENIHGYEKANIREYEDMGNNNLIVTILDSSCDANLADYYKMMVKSLKNNNRVILVSVDDNNKSFKPLASLLVSYNNYDIYQVPEREVISANYLLKLEDRVPDLAEVQTYIGGDVTAYADINTILFGIQSLVDEGNTDKLASFLNEHMLSIENLTTTLNKMKKTCDLFNSNELIDNINFLKKEKDELIIRLDDKDKSIEEIKFERDKAKVDADNLKRENDKLKNKNTDLQSQAESGGSVIKTYQELNTQLIQCKAKHIMYFKEVSYVPYVNSLVNHLTGVLHTKKLKYKLVIYDSNTELYNTYKPLTTVRSSEYLSQKGTLITKTEKFVVAEPNQSILQDILTSDQCFDVVIIYDRMKGIKDLVSGNNVTKFYIINSSKDFEAVKQTLKITDKTPIITRQGVNLNNNSMYIADIAGYKGATASAKQNKYIKLTCDPEGKEMLILSMFKMAYVDLQ